MVNKYKIQVDFNFKKALLINHLFQAILIKKYLFKMILKIFKKLNFFSIMNLTIKINKILLKVFFKILKMPFSNPHNKKKSKKNSSIKSEHFK
jgi:hypothetical protein